MSEHVTKRVPRGLLVAFEGVDGCGKTTQANMARQRLESLGYEALYLREPTSGPFGQKLRELMVAGRDSVTPMQEFELFLKDREQDVRENIRPALDRGAVVCIDRYYISSMAYQGALGLDPEFIRIENEKIAPPPDLILHFRISVEESVDRIKRSRAGGQNLFELQSYQERVAEVFEAMTFSQIVRIDASQGIDCVHADTMDALQKILLRCEPDSGFLRRS